MNTMRPDSDDPRCDEVERLDEHEPALVTPDAISMAGEAPARLDLTGVDPAIALRLAHIAECARIDEAAARESEITALRWELDRVTGKLEQPADRWSGDDTAMAPHRARVVPTDKRWSRSSLIVIALGAVAVASLTLAFLPSPDRNAADRPDTKVASSELPAARDASGAFAKLERGGEPRAEAARDEARAARFQSAKAEATTYSLDVHLAAQRKEVEADAALRDGRYDLAISLYEFARDGYQIATTRSERAAAEIEKARVDAQVTIDAQVAAARSDAARVARRQYAQTADSLVRNGESGETPIRPMFLTPPSSVGPEVNTPTVLREPSVHESSVRESKPRHADSYAAVFAEPTTGSRGGGTWGACWRASLDSARACAKANCEASSTSHRRCVEVASSRPGEYCVVARAHGFGVSTGACSPGRQDAEVAALARCQSQLAAHYGPVPRSCGIAWSSAR